MGGAAAAAAIDVSDARCSRGFTSFGSYRIVYIGNSLDYVMIDHLPPAAERFIINLVTSSSRKSAHEGLCIVGSVMLIAIVGRGVTAWLGTTVCVRQCP